MAKRADVRRAVETRSHQRAHAGSDERAKAPRHPHRRRRLWLTVLKGARRDGTQTVDPASVGTGRRASDLRLAPSGPRHSHDRSEDGSRGHPSAQVVGVGTAAPVRRHSQRWDGWARLAAGCWAPAAVTGQGCSPRVRHRSGRAGCVPSVVARRSCAGSARRRAAHALARLRWACRA